jgi:hypothetical protein
MSVEAIWIVKLISNEQTIGAGVVVLETERILGGDGNFYYVGNYEIRGDKIVMKVRVRRHDGVGPPIFPGLDDYEVEGSGTIYEDTMMVGTEVVGRPDKHITIKFKRLDELP